MKRSPLKLLVIGTFPSTAEPLGGAAVLLKYLLAGLLERDDVIPIVIDTSGGGSGLIGAVRRTVRTLWQTIRKTPQADVVSVHVTIGKLAVGSAVVGTLARLRGRPFILRQFDGWDYRDYHGRLKRALARWAIRKADYYLVETKALLRAAHEQDFQHTFWFPNNRPMRKAGEPSHDRPGPCRRFIFVSQVKPTKGIGELIAAGERFDSDVTVDVYGPFLDGLSERTFEGLKRVHYRGVLAPEDVIPTLAKYDALLLPTYHKGEGYPGIILEAYRAGIPVVSTQWRALPEIVDESCGLLVEPRNADALYEAMRSLVQDDGFYTRLCEGARARQELFATEVWVERFVDYCKSLVNTDV